MKKFKSIALTIRNLLLVVAAADVIIRPQAVGDWMIRGLGVLWLIVIVMIILKAHDVEAKFDVKVNRDE